MKIRTAFLILVIVTSRSAHGGEPGQGDLHAMRKTCADLGREYSVELMFESFPQTSWRIEYKLAQKADYPVLKAYLGLFMGEFRRYPKSFVAKTGLAKVVFVKDLSYQGQLRTAIPDYGKEILILDFERAPHSRIYQRHVIHHEFYHLIEEQFHGTPYFRDREWKQLNWPGFRYGRGGRTAQAGSVYVLTHPGMGFINVYSMSGLEEDKAEIFAILFVEEEYRTVRKWAQKDLLLDGKMKHIRKFLLRIDKSMNAAYWAGLFGKGVEDALPREERIRRSVKGQLDSMRFAVGSSGKKRVLDMKYKINRVVISDRLDVIEVRGRFDLGGSRFKKIVMAFDPGDGWYKGRLEYRGPGGPKTWVVKLKKGEF
ncbi:MAG: hypothetical protein ACYTFG_02570 [Planctomycetota bacterium]|jgi:hypothetical protein